MMQASQGNLSSSLLLMLVIIPTPVWHTTWSLTTLWLVWGWEASGFVRDNTRGSKRAQYLLLPRCHWFAVSWAACSFWEFCVLSQYGQRRQMLRRRMIHWSGVYAAERSIFAVSRPSAVPPESALSSFNQHPACVSSLNCARRVHLDFF